ncbi:beta-glucanase [Kitasatospora sp. NPDC048540]|uniref:hypothetical protein n=1 Tax=unclassified Kitasatospora TaxID=2633591 RepID=UPI00068E80CA|nr:hypothetical protein [Kitasatospora sp. MBT63]
MATRLLLAAAITVSASLATAPAQAATTSAALTAARQLATRSVLAEDFRTLDLGPGHAWGWQTGAYAQCTENPNSWKYDRLTTDSLSTASGHLVITATPQPDGRWNTGLVTTGDSCDSGGSGAMVRTGDLVMVHVRLPAADTGAWPCLWTWRDGGNELDVFEWYADRPDQIEFVNHVRSGSTVYRDANVGAGRWIYVGARFGADNTTWYIGAQPDRLTEAFSDGTGVGEDFAAYLILNLSISDGSFHSPPVGRDPVRLEADLLTIEHPSP